MGLWEISAPELIDASDQMAGSSERECSKIACLCEAASADAGQARPQLFPAL